MNKRNTLLILIAIFSAIGLGIAIYSTTAFFDASKYDFCSYGGTFDCEVVNTSKYATLFGIPVAAFGVLTQLLFLGFVAVYWKKKSELLMTLTGTLAIIAMAFSLYLTSIEAFVLHAWCVLCIGSQLAVLGTFITVFMLKAHDWPKKELKAPESGEELTKE